MDIKRIETLTTSELLSEGQVARLRARQENETQRVLRSALELLGPNGEDWLCGAANPTRCAYHAGNKSCAIGVVQTALGVDRAAHAEDWLRWSGDPLTAAANERGFYGAHDLNDKAGSFGEVKFMFHRAITLAATP